MVGGFLLAGPFVMTEEVWVLAANMSLLQTAAVVSIVFLIGYVTLFKADPDRDPVTEQRLAGIPVRFISLMLISFGSVTILTFLVDAPDTFVDESYATAEMALITFKAISLGSVFSVVGAATADSVF